MFRKNRLNQTVWIDDMFRKNQLNSYQNAYDNQTVWRHRNQTVWRHRPRKSAQIPNQFSQPNKQRKAVIRKNIDTLYRLEDECQNGKIHPDPRHVTEIINDRLNGLMLYQIDMCLFNGQDIGRGAELIVASLAELLTGYCEFLKKAVDRNVPIPYVPHTVNNKTAAKKKQPRQPRQPTRWNKLLQRIRDYVQPMINRIVS